ncbi:phasin family protein [Halomonas sp. ML-15]|nr:phasin family protein [Halomonas sp. ML-15]
MEKGTDRAKQQFDSSMVEPVRAYGSLTTDYYEKLFSTQFDAVRAFADTSLAQSRSWLEVRDSESFQQVVEEQQHSIREMGERLKADTDKISSLSQEYLKETQQLAMGSMQTGQKQLEENMQKGQQQLKENFQKGQDQVNDGMQKAKSSEADKVKK